MLQYCSNLTYINLSSFQTKNVTIKSYIFNDCSNLTNINLSFFDTKNVKNMTGMFNGCDKLKNKPFFI